MSARPIPTSKSTRGEPGAGEEERMVVSSLDTPRDVGKGVRTAKDVVDKAARSLEVLERVGEENTLTVEGSSYAEVDVTISGNDRLEIVLPGGTSTEVRYIGQITDLSVDGEVIIRVNDRKLMDTTGISTVDGISADIPEPRVKRKGIINDTVRIATENPVGTAVGLGALGFILL